MIEIHKNDPHSQYISKYLVIADKILAKKYRKSHLTNLLLKNKGIFFTEVYRFYEGIVVFDCLNIENLSETITRSINSDIKKFTYWIINRYKSVNIGDFLYEDYQGLQNLSDRLKTYLINTNDRKKLSHYLITKLKEEIDKACDQLTRTE